MLYGRTEQQHAIVEWHCASDSNECGTQREPANLHIFTTEVQRAKQHVPAERWTLRQTTTGEMETKCRLVFMRKCAGVSRRREFDRGGITRNMRTNRHVSSTRVNACAHL